MNDPSVSNDVLALVREAAEWRLISVLFECPAAGWDAQVAALAEEAADPQLKQAAELAAQEADLAAYHTTFGPGGPVPPREVSYRQNVLPGRALAEIGDLYQAFAYTPSTQEAPDHVCVEAGFVSYLRLKEAYARSCGDHGKATVTQSAARRFLEEHICPIAEPLAESLGQSGIRYLSLAAAALLARAQETLD
jgi:nitrate reductase assembly molybdenum cofactor insertion protein NarJ